MNAGKTRAGGHERFAVISPGTAGPPGAGDIVQKDNLFVQDAAA
jgi:hypothetical protein